VARPVARAPVVWKVLMCFSEKMARHAGGPLEI